MCRKCGQPGCLSLASDDMPTVTPGKTTNRLDRNAVSGDRLRRNMQRLSLGAATQSLNLAAPLYLDAAGQLSLGLSYPLALSGDDVGLLINDTLIVTGNELGVDLPNIIDNYYIVESGGVLTVDVANLPATVPGGGNGDIQYNNSGVFDGSDSFYFDGTNMYLTGGTAYLASVQVYGDVYATEVHATEFYGDGSNLTGITAAAAGVGGSVQFQSPSGYLDGDPYFAYDAGTLTLTVFNLYVNDMVTAGLFSGSGADLYNVTADALTPAGTVGQVWSMLPGPTQGWANLPATVPGGGNGDIQYNNSGVFDGSDSFYFDGTNMYLTGGTAYLASVQVYGDVYATEVHATEFYGDGSNLTGITAAAAGVGGSVQFQSPSGYLDGDPYFAYDAGTLTLTVFNLYVNDMVTAGLFSGSGADLYNVTADALTPAGTVGQVWSMLPGPTQGWANVGGGSTPVTGSGSLVTGLTTASLTTVLTVTFASAAWNTAGRFVRVRLGVNIVPVASNNYSFLVTDNPGNTLYSSQSFNPFLGSPNPLWIEFDMRVLTTGSSGTVAVTGTDTSGTTANINSSAVNGLGPVDLTGTTSLKVIVGIDTIDDPSATVQVLEYSVETLT